MRLAWTVEQVFVRRAGAQLEVLMVIENPAGARFRERFTMPGRDREEAVRRAARWLAYRSQVEGVRGLRLRVEEQGGLRDDPELRDLFSRELRSALDGDGH